MLIVALGNPGSEYAHTRHNVGWMVLDEVLRRHPIPMKREGQAMLGRGSVAGAPVVAMRPLTYMNLSGQAAGQAARYFKFRPEQVLAIYDDLALPFGTLRLRSGGGAAGHNGVKSLIQHLGTEDFPRLRVGIGPKPPGADQAAFVLGAFKPAEREQLPDILLRAADAVEAVLKEGLTSAMNRYNAS